MQGPTMAQLAELRHHPLPWRCDPGGFLVDADGAMVHADDRPTASLIADAVNAYVETPAPQYPDRSTEEG